MVKEPIARGALPATTRHGVWALPFSLERLEPTGEPFQVVAGARGPSVGADGSLLYTPGQISRAQSLVWVSREGKVEGSAAELPDQSGGLALSPDGTRIAVAMNDGGFRNIWAIDVGRGTRTKLSPDLGNAGRPAFSPDGKQLAFGRNNQVFVVPAGEARARPELVRGAPLEAEALEGDRLVIGDGRTWTRVLERVRRSSSPLGAG